MLFAARDYISGDSFVLQRCDRCGLVRTHPQPSREQLIHYYPPGYYGREKRYATWLERLLGGLYALRAWRLESVNGSGPGRVLDIGCGRGAILQQLRRRGWEISGTELTEMSARYARDVLRIDVAIGDVVDLALPGESFTAIILWHVLEHVADPDTMLHEVARLLRPGGTLLVAVPNFASVESSWAKAGWFHLDVPRHLQHFTPSVLRKLLEDSELQPQHTSYFAAEYDFFSFVQTALNALGIRQNTLYNLLRARGAKFLQGDQPVALPSIIASLLLAPILGVMSLVWVPFMALSRRGGTVIIYAKKS